MQPTDDQSDMDKRAEVFLDLWSMNLSLWAQEKPEKAQEILQAFAAKMGANMMATVAGEAKSDD